MTASTGKKRGPENVTRPPLDYTKNKIIPAERVAEIDKELARILKGKETDDITPGRPSRR